MKKGAIIIGVHKTGAMTALPAAIKSAKGFQAWAVSQGFETRMHLDENNAEVTVQDIKNSIKSFVDERTFSQLIVYFSGHGILKSANDEQWLLSRAPGDSNEAISLTSSIAISRNSGISYITFISDACRCIPDNLLNMQLTGQQVFPNLPPPEDRSRIDVFYAAIPGSPAHELKQKDAVDGYRGAYTHCLLLGLNGKVPQIITKQEAGGDVFGLVEANELQGYLRTAVPLEVASTSLLLKQIPEAEITSRLPLYLSKIDNIKPAFNTVEFKNLRKQFELNFTTPERQQYFKEKVFTHIEEVDNKKLAESFELLKNAKGRESFETMTGFTVVGQKINNVYTKPGTFDIFEENGSTQIRIHDVHLKSIILELNGGCGVPLAVLRGFIGTIVIQDGTVINVNYTPSKNSPRYIEYTAYDSEIIDRRAIIATAARFGRFKLDGNPENMETMAGYLRYLKAFDPTLGLYAAYAYAQAGEYGGITSIYRYMRAEPEPVIFDVAMLTILLGDKREIKLREAAPFCPMLSQGWSYLSINYDLVSPPIKNLSKYLIPGLWTTFNKKGVAKLKETIDIKEFS